MAGTAVRAMALTAAALLLLGQVAGAEGDVHRFAVAPIGGLRPTVTGTTDLPDGTELLVNVKKVWLPDAQQRLARGLPGCEQGCLPATGPSGESLGVKATVAGQRFSAGPYSFGGQPFTRGPYIVEVFITTPPTDRETAGLTPRQAIEIEVERLKNPAYSTTIQVRQ